MIELYRSCYETFQKRNQDYILRLEIVTFASYIILLAFYSDSLENLKNIKQAGTNLNWHSSPIYDIAESQSEDRCPEGYYETMIERGPYSDLQVNLCKCEKNGSKSENKDFYFAAIGDVCSDKMLTEKCFNSFNYFSKNINKIKDKMLCIKRMDPLTMNYFSMKNFIYNSDYGFPENIYTHCGSVDTENKYHLLLEKNAKCPINFVHFGSKSDYDNEEQFKKYFLKIDPNPEIFNKNATLNNNYLHSRFIFFNENDFLFFSRMPIFKDYDNRFIYTSFILEKDFPCFDYSNKLRPINNKVFFNNFFQSRHFCQYNSEQEENKNHTNFFGFRRVAKFNFLKDILFNKKENFYYYPDLNKTKLDNEIYLYARNYFTDVDVTEEYVKNGKSQHSINEFFYLDTLIKKNFALLFLLLIYFEMIFLAVNYLTKIFLCGFLKITYLIYLGFSSFLVYIFYNEFIVINYYFLFSEEIIKMGLMNSSKKLNMHIRSLLYSLPIIKYLFMGLMVFLINLIKPLYAIYLILRKNINDDEIKNTEKPKEKAQ